MTLREFKQSNLYQEATEVILVVNGTEQVDAIYYPQELDSLEVLFYGCHVDGKLDIGIACSNWDSRNEPGWVAED